MIKKSVKRRQRRHGDLPAGFIWRDGRPRWKPSPTRAKQGWRGLNLKDAWGKWLAKGAAIDRAQAIAEAVKAWAVGVPVPAGLAAIAPKGAAASGATPATLSPRSIHTLLEAYYDSPKFKALGERTQADYRNKLRRFFETIVDATDDRQALDKKVDKFKALDVDILLPPAFQEAGHFEIERAYDLLAEQAGPSMAYGVHAAVSAWLGWCVKKKRIWPTNPAELVERKTPKGRIEVFDWPEIIALVGAAEAKGLASIADAVILAVDLSWSQQDLLALGWGQISADDKVKHRRIKTGVAGNPPLLAIGRQRLKVIRARWAEAKVRPTHVIVCELTGQPWNAHTFRHAFAEVRALAAKTCPSVLDKQFRDTRDTAVTYAYEANLEIPEICSRTLHDPDRAQAVITKHYGAIRQGIADRAAEKLDAHFDKMGYTFEARLGLQAPGENG